MRTFFALLLLVALPTAPALAAGADDVRQFVDSLGQKVVSVVNSGGGDAQKQQLQQMFIENVDIDWMAQFVAGRGWQQASEEQLTRYKDAFKRYLLMRYTTNFAEYTGSQYTIAGTRDEGDGQYTVGMQIKSGGAQTQDIQAGYRVRGAGGSFKIVDIIVEGVSLITTQRSEFASVLQQKGMDGLIESLETKVGK